MRRIVVWALALLLLITTIPMTALAQDGFGPTRDIYLPAYQADTARAYYVDLETNRVVSNPGAADLFFVPGGAYGDGQLVMAAGQGIYLVGSNFDSLPPSDSGVPYARQAPIQISGGYLVRTHSGRLARLSPLGFATDDHQTIHIQYALVGDTEQNPANDSGTIIVGFNPMVTINIGQSVLLDLDAGTLAMDGSRADVQLTMSGNADNLVGAEADVRVLAGQGVINEGIRGFDGLRQFPASGFLQQAHGRALDLYLVKTRSGKYAKFIIDKNMLVIPYGSRGSDTPQTHNFVVRLATQSGAPQVVRTDNGGLQTKNGVAMLTGQGVNVAAGQVTDKALGDIYLVPGYYWASSTGTANIRDMGATPPDKLKTVPTTGYVGGPVQALEGHTYAVKLRDGKYGLVYLSRKADGGAAVVDTYYQPDGSTQFFDFLSQDNGMDISNGSLQIGSTGYLNNGTFANNGGKTDVVGGGTTPPNKTTTGSGELGDPNKTTTGSGALGGGGRTVPSSDWNISAQIFPGKVYLQWGYPPGLSSSEVKGFFVFQGDTPADANTPINESPLGQMWYTVEGLPDGKTTYVRVRVFDQQQELGKTSVVLAVTPGANGTVKVVPGGTSVGGGDVTTGGASGNTNTGTNSSTARKVWFQLGSTTMKIDGMAMQIDVPAQRVDNLSYVPFRALADALGAKVEYNDMLRVVSFNLNGRVLQLFLNAPSNAMVNGTFVKLDNGPVVVNGRTLVPVRFVSEQLGANVTWNQDEQSITITSP